MPRPYALQNLSHPTHPDVTDDIWTQWHTKEHLRKLVQDNGFKSSTLYTSNTASTVSGDRPVTLSEEDIDDFKFLSLHQTNSKPHPGATTDLDTESALFPHRMVANDLAGLTETNLQLVEILGTYEEREDVAPFLLHHAIFGNQIENKIQFDHVNAVAELEGYRRTLLYRLLGSSGQRFGREVVMVHEFDGKVDVSALDGVKGELEGIEATAGCGFVLKAWELVACEGFGPR